MAALLDPYWPVLILYIGPQALLPFVSMLAGAAGVVLLFWQQLLTLARKILRRPSDK
jgi:hypothetical protein